VCRKSEALAQEAETLQQEIVDLSNRLAWRQVHDLEIQFDLKEVERNTHIAALDKARAKRAELEAQFGGAAQLEEAKQKHTAVIERENRRVVELMRAISGKDQDVIRVKNEQKGLISRIDGLKKRIHALQRKKADNDAKIAAIAAANSRDTGAADAQRAKRKEDLLAQKATLQADRAKLLLEMEKLRDKERSEIAMHMHKQMHCTHAHTAMRIRMTQIKIKISFSSAALCTVLVLCSVRSI